MRLTSMVLAAALTGCLMPAGEDVGEVEGAIHEAAYYVGIETIDGRATGIDAIVLRKRDGATFYATALAAGSPAAHAAVLGPPDAYPDYPNRRSACVAGDPEPTYATMAGSVRAIAVRMGAPIEPGDHLTVLEAGGCPSIALGISVAGMLVFDESGSIDGCSIGIFDESGSIASNDVRMWRATTCRD